MNFSGLKDKVLMQNILSQGVVQLAVYAIPLLIIPYVTRVLEPERFGMACYAQNIVAYFTLLVNFGFGIAATQEVAINKDDHQKLESIFWTVIGFKGLLLLLSFAILAGLYAFMPKVHDNFELFFAAALFNVGTLFFPYWFFQGVERMAKMSLFVFFIRAVGAVLVVLFVKTPDHAMRYLLALSVSNIVVGLVALFYVVRQYRFKFGLPENWFKAEVVRKSFPIFINAFLVDCNMLVGVTFLGIYLSDYEIGIYSGAQKIMTAIIMVATQPIVVALFPRMSKKFKADRKEGLAYLQKCLLPIAAFSAIVSLAVYFLAPIAVQIMLGSKFQNSIPLLCLFAPLVFLSAIATTFTVQGIFGMQLQKFAPILGVIIFVFNCIACYLLIPTCGVFGAAYAWMLCQIVEILTVIIVMYRHQNR